MATIEIRIRALAQLFDSLDPSPFHERGLDRNADDYIFECAGDHPPQEPLRLLIHAPDSLRPNAADTAQAIHGHYRLAHTQAERRHRRRMRAGRVALLIGVAVLVAALVMRGLLGDFAADPVGQVIAEGLLILGWVAMWRPVELLLFERWENRQERLLLDRLSRIPVEFAVLPHDGP